MSGRNEHSAAQSGDNQHHASRESKHPLEYAIFFFVVLTAIATGIAACYTRNQWITADDAEKRQLRAYLSARVAEGEGVYDLTPDTFATAQIRFRNSGPTPAYKVHHQSSMMVFPYPLPEGANFAMEKPKRPPTIMYFPPNFEDGIGTNVRIDRVFTLDEINSISDGVNYRLYVIGVINYLDAFDIPHYTKFCFSFYGISPRIFNYDYCSQHNDAS